MTIKKYPMTTTGKIKLLEELEELKTTERQRSLARIKTARTFCDFREDSEFEAATKEQTAIEQRILLIEEMLFNAEIIEETTDEADVVVFGKPVTFIELPDGDEETYTIVGIAEADPLEGKISNDSPLALSLLGHHLHDEVTVPTPSGEMHVKITKIG